MTRQTQAPPAANDDLKQLGFVPELSTKVGRTHPNDRTVCFIHSNLTQRLTQLPSLQGYKMATDAYEAVKAKAPSPLKEQMSSVETKAAPYVSQAADTSAQLVKKLDVQVDSAVKSAQSAREEYLKKVEAVVAFLKSQSLKGAAAKAIEQVEKSVAEARKVPGAVLKKVEEAFAKLMETEAVQNVLSSGKYKALYDICGNLYTHVSQTWMYKKASENVYPLVSKYADPAMEYATAAVALVKPVGSP